MTRRILTPYGHAWITINRENARLAQVFITLGKAGSDVSSFAEGLGRLCNLYLRTTGGLFSESEQIEQLAHQLRHVGGHAILVSGADSPVSSLPDALAWVLIEYRDIVASLADAGVRNYADS